MGRQRFCQAAPRLETNRLAVPEWLSATERSIVATPGDPAVGIGFKIAIEHQVGKASG